jgi:tetratricopeptide (TPR) repeat protein
MWRPWTLFLLLLAIAAFTPLHLLAQTPESAPAGQMTLIDSDEAICRVAESRLPSPRPRNVMCIVGVAQHPSGIARVLLNGMPAVLQPQAAGETQFAGFVPRATLDRDIEIIAYPAGGQPIMHVYGLVVPEGADARSGGYLMRKEVSLAAAAGEPPAPVRGEPDREQAGREEPGPGATVVILEPREWMGEGTRSIRVPRDRSLRVVGRAHHPSGIARVTVNGQEAALQPHPSGAMHFITYVSAEAAEQGIHVHAFPLRGEASTKVFGAGPGVAAAPPPSAPAPGSPAALPAVPTAVPTAASAPTPAADEAPLERVAEAPAPAAVADARHYIDVHEPGAWSGSGSRSLAAPVRQSVRIVGEARHLGGVRTVLIDNARASLHPQPNGAVRFIGYVPVRSTTQAIEIRVEGQTGAPLRREYTLEPVAAEQPAAGAVFTAQAGQRFRGQRWAVVVGISAYRDAGITSLKYADRDAQAVYDFLVSERAGAGGFKPENIRLLLNEEATYQALRSALFTFLKSSTEEDQVVVYFAGHGAPDPQRRDDLYLLAYDTRADDISGTAFPMYDVQNAVQRVLARDILVITDACHGGGVAQSLAMRNLETNMINEIFLSQLNSSTGGIVTFTASMANQTSAEDERWGGGHGIFTYYLLEALNGAADEDGDGIVTLVEMMEWTKDRVRRETRNAQVPNISTTAYDQLWPMSIITAPGQQVAGEAPRPAPPAPRPPPAARTGETPRPAPPAARTGDAPAATRPPARTEELARARERVRLYPNSALYWSELGQLLHAVGESEEAISALQSATRLEPNNAVHRYELGTLLRETGHAEAAVLALREAVRLAQRNAQYLNALGQALGLAGQLGPAIEEHRRAVRLEPSRGSYQRDLGFALAQLARSREALAAYEEALRLEPGVAQYHFEYARLLGTAGRQVDLVLSLQTAVRLDSANFAYQRELGQALQQSGRVQEAIAAYRSAVRLEPNDAQLRYDLSQLYHNVGLQFETIEALREAVRLDPETARYHFDLGVALRASARPEDALSEFREALRLEPRNALYRNGYGLALHRVGQVPEALEELREASRLEPSIGQYPYDLAVVLKEAGLFDEAIAALEAALRIERNHPGYRDELRNVRQLKSERERRRS